MCLCCCVSLMFEFCEVVILDLCVMLVGYVEMDS